MQPITSPMSPGRVLQTTLAVFVENFPRLLVVGLLPFLPGITALGVWFHLRSGAPATAGGGVWLLYLAGILLLPGSVVSYVMAVRVAADACEGKSTSLKGALRYCADPAVGKSFLTLLTLVFALSAVMFPALLVRWYGVDGNVAVVTGVLCEAVVLALAPLLMFAPAVVVAEGSWTVAAMRRSVELGWGRCLRNWGVLLAGMVLLLGMSAAISVVLGLLPPSTLPDGLRWLAVAPEGVSGAGNSNWLLQDFGWLSLPLAWLVAVPVYPVLILVMYYDMRVRNGESFAPLPVTARFPDPPKLQQDGKSFGALPPKTRTRVAGGKGGTRNM
ncbi:MAG: hypothetical protein OEW11_08795 [Nitrospirota bacterium]|nr:hypothetical protein [Nitrospirota bacterium]